jgi:asparagine synthase (glutamine-hydrolysing)
VAKFALSTLPREHGIKVVITGEGSDEHFAGYPYFPAEFLRERDGGLPDSILAQDDELRERLQRSASDEMNAVWRSQGAAEYEGASTAPIMADARGNTMPESLLAWHPSNHLFQNWVQDQYGESSWDMRETVMKGHSAEVRAKMREKWHPAHTAMYMWNKSTLINVILSCLGDRTEMAHSIEARTPFLDHKLAEYVNSLPPSTKLRYTPPEEDGKADDVDNFWWKAAGEALRTVNEKAILREAARPYITDELYKRRKLPFLAPTRWKLNGPLHNMFKKLLTREAVEKLGFVDYDVVEKALGGAFGEKPHAPSFRILCYTGGWVSLSQRFGVKKATKEGSGWA